MSAKIIKNKSPIKTKPCVFLGGTCAESTWRDELIKMIDVPYFNPVVEDWTPECIEIENREKVECHWTLFVITPRMKGVYSIAEAVECAILTKERCIFCVLSTDGELEFDKGQMKSLNATADLIAKYNNGATFDNLKDVADYLNNTYKNTEFE